MDEQERLAFDFARDTTKQLITLSTAIITISVTFSKDIFGNPDLFTKGLLVAVLLVFLLSVVFGVWTLQALTGSLGAASGRTDKEQDDTASAPSIYGSNITKPSFWQIFTFVAALGLTVCFGIRSII